MSLLVNGGDYALVTAAFNEEALIERVIESIAAQTVRPQRWVIVSDGSTDRTEDIVLTHARKLPFLQLHRKTDRHPRNFAAQVLAINTGFNLLRSRPYAYIGNLDADITFQSTYFERLMQRFDEDPQLGLAGGEIYEMQGGAFAPRRTNNVNSVPHGVQLFRRACFDAIGEYVPLPYGGPDWHAEVRARMHGWRVVSFPGLPAYHHRPTGTAVGLLQYWYRQGLMDYSLGSHPLFEIAKLTKRLSRPPVVVGALVRFAGFLQSSVRRERRPVSDEFVSFLRREQTARLRLSAHAPSLVSSRKPDRV